MNLLNALFFMTSLSFFTNAYSESLPTEVRQKQLIHMLKHDCGSCHGMTLKGGLGPALLVSSLKQFSDEYLFTVIKYGKAEKAMPPWGKILKDDEIKFLIRYLRDPK